MNAIFALTTVLWLSGSLEAGILISRSDQGLIQFNEASAVFVNGKDKVLNLGAQAKLSAPINKLPSVKLGGTLLQDIDAGALALSEEGALSYLLPEGLPKSAPNDTAGLWKTSRISYKKSASDKAQSDISMSAFVAFLPGGTVDLAALCKAPELLQVVGGKGRILSTQLELLAAAAKEFPADSAVATLEKFVEQSMAQRYERFTSGAAGAEVLEEGLKFAALSAAVYPKDAEQERLRNGLSQRKAWLDRKIAVLRAFSAVRDWDAFLLGDREFEKYQQAFPEIQKRHAEALNASLQLHRQTGEELLKEREFGGAWRELRLASLRQPSDRVLQQQVSMAWADYSREVAIDRKDKRKELTAGQRDVVNQDLLFATKYKEANKLDDALKNVKEAEAIDPESLSVLLKKAEVLGARREINDALAALDEYDLRAVDEEREPASKLRSELLFQRASSVQDVKAQFLQAWADGRFHKAHELALQGLRAKDDDAELLYDGGLSALVIRAPEEGRGFFTRYLEMANTLDTDAGQRAKVRSLLPTITDAPAPAGSTTNWLSGNKQPAGVYYDPVSLAFQPGIDHIDASNKMKVNFEWQGERLKAIVPSFDKNEHATGERKISFAYDEHFPQVNAIGYEDEAKSISTSDPDEIYKQSSLVVLNNPYIDPLAVQKFAAKNVSLGIAGNKFFLPFVWGRICYFRLSYDGRGRVSQAREIAAPGAGPGDLLLEFDWDEWQLKAIRGYQGTDESHRVKVYERTMEYQEGRLVAEEIHAQGKSSRIKYNYNGSRLASANCEKDGTLDGRSRQVYFR
jgi:hypothetical protein